MYNVSLATIVGMIVRRKLYVEHNNFVFLVMTISRWEIPGINVYFVPGICQPARKSPGIDFSGNRSLGASEPS